MMTGFFSYPLYAAGPGYGIQGETAPSLTAQAWVDTEGNPGQPFNLEDHRGKVVYLLFFQDW